MYVAVIRFPDSQEDLDYKSSPSLSCQQIYHIRGASRQGGVNFGNLLQIEKFYFLQNYIFGKNTFRNMHRCIQTAQENGSRMAFSGFYGRVLYQAGKWQKVSKFAGWL